MKKKITMHQGGKIIFSFIFLLFFLWGCGDPKINANHSNFKKYTIETRFSTEALLPTDYLIGAGDELEILYYIDPGSTFTEYMIDTEDTLRIESYSYPALNKTVKVRPDGFITLARIGDVKAVDIEPKELAQKIKKLYEPFFLRSDVTVELINFNVKIEKLKAAIKTTTRGQSKQVVVRPDGKISLPYIQDVLATNMTCMELSQLLEKKYRKFVNNVSVTTAMLKAHSNKVYIMGEVARANFYALPGPLTLTQLIAKAGGFSRHANTHQIVLIRRAKDGRPDARLVDMDKIIGQGDMTSDPIIRQYDVVFVPKTKISQGALVMESIMSFIPMRFSSSYSLGGKDVE
ncbi:MAG: hypothetical protein D3923_00570 [Candidatus Electrothrix sp. AR3]|nr:hypothetical protein [Candidatus Electrothrix sp. AR3]